MREPTEQELRSLSPVDLANLYRLVRKIHDENVDKQNKAFAKQVEDEGFERGVPKGFTFVGYESNGTGPWFKFINFEGYEYRHPAWRIETK